MNQPHNRSNYIAQKILASILLIVLLVLLLPSHVLAQGQELYCVINNNSNGLIQIRSEPSILSYEYFGTPKTYRITVENIVGFDWLAYSTGVWLALEPTTSGNVRVELESRELILPFQESGKEKVTLPPHSDATYDVTFDGPGTVSFNADMIDIPTYGVSMVADALKLFVACYIPGGSGLIDQVPEAVLGVIETVPAMNTLVTDIENCFTLGEYPSVGQIGHALFKIFDWINNDNNRVALLYGISDKFKLGLDTKTIGTDLPPFYVPTVMRR